MAAENLDALLLYATRHWSLRLLPPFTNLSVNYVAPVLRSDGSHAVLKVVIPCRELHTEIAALRVYDGRSCVRLLDADSERGLLLLEHILPGSRLTALASQARDDEATQIAASVMRDLWRPVTRPHPFPTVGEWVSGFERMRHYFGGGGGPFPAALVDKAEAISRDLLATAPESVLLHGDLHHDNILLACQGGKADHWLAIDPKGVVGEPAYEVGALLRNLWPAQHTIAEPARLLSRRIDLFSDVLEIDRIRVLGWGIAQAVLASWWCIEDNPKGNNWQEAISVAALLASLSL